MPKTKTEVETVEPIVCPICGETFKSKSGLSGHMQLSHSELKVKTYPDEIGQKLQNIEKELSETPSGKQLTEILIRVLDDYDEKTIMPILNLIEKLGGIVGKSTEKTIKAIEAIAEQNNTFGKRISVLEKTDIKPEKQSDKAVPKEREHLKEPASEQVKLLEDLLKQQLDRRDLLLKYDQNGKPFTEKKPRPRGIF